MTLLMAVNKSSDSGPLRRATPYGSLEYLFGKSSTDLSLRAMPSNIVSSETIASALPDFNNCRAAG